MEAIKDSIGIAPDCQSSITSAMILCSTYVALMVLDQRNWFKESEESIQKLALTLEWAT